MASVRRTPRPMRPSNLAVARPALLGLSRLASIGVLGVKAAPFRALEHEHHDNPDGASLWILYVASVVLVLLGGAFAGLTIALMGQDGIYLQVVARDYSEPQHGNARRVFDLLQKGKHWVLVTLLLSNVIVNETLPVVLDRCLGGGIAAVVGSTVLIVIFGEILPQSVCVRYGLQIGGFMSKPVLILMWLLAPIAWPTAKLLDKVLGEDHGTVYKKSGLKTLVTLHKSLGEVSDRLNQDEVTIISAVLDLKEKPVETVMTPMEDVFVMSEDTVLDEKTMDLILSAGYSRIPIHEHGNPNNFVGMLLVKILITYDPEDGKRVRDFPLATLPETRPETSCLDIVNFFQEGKSHMVLVSEYPGEDHGALGVVTLEDVIEELIGEEIIDESDVYIDVHKAIRRLAPAPKAKVQRRPSEDPTFKSNDATLIVEDEGNIAPEELRHKHIGSLGANADALGSSPKTATVMMRRSSTSADGNLVKTTVPVRANIQDLRQHLRHLGPSNPAINPKGTRSTTVKIKPGIHPTGSNHARDESIASEIVTEVPQEDGDETTRLIRPQLTGKDGIHALRQSYGSMSPEASRPNGTDNGGQSITVEIEGDPTAEDIERAGQALVTAASSQVEGGTEVAVARSSSNHSTHSDRSDSNSGTPTPKRHNVRTGSITENIIESRGVRKVVLETTSSNDEEDVSLRLPPSPQELRAQTQALNPGMSSTALPLPGSEEDERESEPGGSAGTGRTADGEVGSGFPGIRKKTRRKKRKGGGGS